MRGAISASACIGAFAAGEAVGDDADMMAAIGLTVGEIQDVPENAADRRARRVQDTKRLTFNHRHDQNQRSPTSTVSPGPIGGARRHDEAAGAGRVGMRDRDAVAQRARGEKPPAMATALSTVMFGT